MHMQRGVKMCGERDQGRPSDGERKETHLIPRPRRMDKALIQRKRANAGADVTTAPIQVNLVLSYGDLGKRVVDICIRVC